MNQAVSTKAPRQYRLRKGSESISLRHATTDVFALIEVFAKDIYELPPEISTALQNLAAGRQLRVLDLGAHVGTFGIWTFRQFPGARLVSIEAAPSTYPLLRATLEAHSEAANWASIHAAASVTNAVGTFIDTAGTDARLTATREGSPVHLIDVLPLIADADLVKIDVEGEERRLLADPRFRNEPNPVAMIAEFHGADNTERDRLGRELMDQAGYGVLAMRDGVAFALRLHEGRLGARSQHIG